MTRSAALVRWRSGWHKLEVNTFGVHEGFDTGRALVVEHLKYGA